MKITSLYGMAQLNFTPSISVLAGLRFEDTQTGLSPNKKFLLANPFGFV